LSGGGGSGGGGFKNFLIFLTNSGVLRSIFGFFCDFLDEMGIDFFFRRRRRRCLSVIIGDGL